MKYCTGCGSPLEDDDRFCGSCGAPQPQQNAPGFVFHPEVIENAVLHPPEKRKRKKKSC